MVEGAGLRRTGLIIALAGFIIFSVPLAVLNTGKSPASEAVINSTVLLRGEGGVQYAFYAPPGSTLRLATTQDEAGNATYVVIVEDQAGGVRLQTRETGGAAWTVPLDAGGYYMVKVLNPLPNATYAGAVVGVIDYEEPLYATAKSSTYLAASLPGAVIAGVGIGILYTATRTRPTTQEE